MSFINTDWDYQKLQEFIEARGTEVIVEAGMACTCRNGDQYAATIFREGVPASQRSITCEQCTGDGFIYRNARIVLGLLTRVDPGGNRKLIESGYAVPGDAVFSTSLREDPLNDFDKVTFLFSSAVGDGQVIMRGASHLEENATYVTDLAKNEDRLWYEADCNIWCEDENGVIYTQDSDFVFDAKKIQWVGNKPNDGTLYTIKYTAFLEWIVYSTPFDRVDRDNNLGQRVLLKKKHTALYTDRASDSVADRQQRQVDFTTRTKI